MLILAVCQRKTNARKTDPLMLDFIKGLFAKKQYKELEADEFRKAMRAAEKPVLLDVRMKWEYDKEKIPKSQNFDVSNAVAFRKKIDYMDRAKPYFVYCQSGMRSAKACRLMTEMGFEDVTNLKGGIRQWNGKTQ